MEKARGWARGRLIVGEQENRPGKGRVNWKTGGEREMESGTKPRLSAHLSSGEEIQ
jgi:hypothetical protein